MRVNVGVPLGAECGVAPLEDAPIGMLAPVALIGDNRTPIISVQAEQALRKVQAGCPLGLLGAGEARHNRRLGATIQQDGCTASRRRGD